MKHRVLLTLLLGMLSVSLAACGDSPGERAVSGGLIGAGAGAAIIAATGGAPLIGALAGAAVGSIGGAATAPHDAGPANPPAR